jgi:tyrosyl-tRNA synthetase
MLGFDSVKIRLEREQPLTFLEFNYMILQAYDFLELARRHKCVAQLGGSDQWGNIVNGVELGRRCDDKALYGLTSPLITLASGAKMGKSAAGAVWLNEERLSAYDYWQFWRNTEDADVGRFLRLFTELPLPEIERLESLEGAEINEAKIVLANEATRLCRGDAAAADAEATARKVFVEGGLGGDLPEITVFRHLLDTPEAQYIKILVESGLQSSKSEARKLIRNAGLRKNDQVVPDENASISSSDFVTMDTLKLSIGKKRHIKVRVVDAK